MKALRRLFRSVLIWAGPVLVLLLMVVSGFVWWVVRTEDGTRWALVTAVRQFDGQVSGVRGSFWNNLRIGRLDVNTPAAAVQLSNLHLDAQWRAVLERKVHVRDLSVDSLAVQWRSSEPSGNDQPFQIPALPVSVQLDRLAVNELRLTQNGVDIPIDVRDFSSALHVAADGGQFVLQSLVVQHQTIRMALQGQAQVASLQEPWPFTVSLSADAVGMTDDSPLCARQHLPSLPTQDKGEQACTLAIQANAHGDMSSVALQARGTGQGMSLQTDLSILPQAAFPLQQGTASLTLADGSSLDAELNWKQADAGSAALDKVGGKVTMRQLNLGQLLGPVIPDALLSMALSFQGSVQGQSVLHDAALDLRIDEGSRWNKQAAQGHLSLAASGLADLSAELQKTKGSTKASGSVDPQANVQPVNGSPSSALPGGAPNPDLRPQPIPSRTTSVPAEPPSGVALDVLPALQALRISKLDMDIALGANRVKGQGGWGDAKSRLSLDINAPQLAHFWPGLPGGAGLQGELAGSLNDHQLDLKARYTPADSKRDRLGQAPFDIATKVRGGWRSSSPEAKGQASGWQGTVQSLQLIHDEITASITNPVTVGWRQVVAASEPQWLVGAARLQVQLSKMRRPLLVLDHVSSEGGAGRWSTRGQIESLRVSPWRVKRIRQLLDMVPQQADDQGGVVVLGEEGNDRWAVNLGASWNLAFAGALEGDVQIRRLSGDVMVPAEPDFPLGLQTFDLRLQARPTQGGVSRLDARLEVDTQKMGRLQVRANSVLRTTPQGGFRIDPADRTTVDVDAAIDDLAWVGLFTGGGVEFGGKLLADLRLSSRADGQWSGSGTLRGDGLRVVRLDDGIRLLDGTLQARLQGTRVILEKLYFPARLRVTPKEWRTAEWVSQNPDAKGGGLTLTGDWELLDSRGVLNVDLYRFPLLQRSDRYAMVSGKVLVRADLPKIDIQGQVTADAGWFDLDMLGGIPTVDSDVIVLQPGQEVRAPAVPAEISMSLKLDLGPRFYLTGYGVDSGLVGDLTLTMAENTLRALGALRTRGGAIEAYGQRLQLRRGTVTFQGDVANPILNIEALRTGLQVEAGVRVAGTARRPRIDLVSYPQVSEIEKLSWLLLGHGPNDTGGDVALLFSVGSSFLSDGEPFYRKFGIDEVSMRSGDLGAVGSVLPSESVVSSMDSGTSDIERRFISASKTLASGFTLSVRQALNDTGTVGRISYRLARGLNAELSVGTINGLALIYRWFSRD